MHAEADAFTQRTTAECGIPAAGYLGGRAPTAQETNCLLGHFGQERSQLLQRLSGDAMDEAQLRPEQTIAIQGMLKEKGFLAANEAIDGVFGPATRAAIGDWQRSVGQRATGFGSMAMLDQPQSPPQAPAPAPATPPTHAAYTGGAQQEPSDDPMPKSSAEACVDKDFQQEAMRLFADNFKPRVVKIIDMWNVRPAHVPAGRASKVIFACTAKVTDNHNRDLQFTYTLEQRHGEYFVNSQWRPLH
jgi:peptidoglycan hydrolase-like protein with peptidoglycan-binding domain